MIVLASTQGPQPRPLGKTINGSRVRRQTQKRFVEDKRQTLRMIRDKINADLESADRWLTDLIDKEESKLNQWDKPEPIEPEVIVKKDFDGYDL